jgi:xylulokinase
LIFSAMYSNGPLIVAHDVGSTGDKAVLTDLTGKILHSSYISYNMIYPAIGLAEQDPDFLWQAVIRTTRKLLEETGTPASQIAGIGISAQMFNLIPVDENFRPLTNMITWMDLRGIEQAEHMFCQVSQEQFIEWTANVPNAKDIIPKILWLKEVHPKLWSRTYKLLDCKEYLIYQLTGNCAIDWHGASVFMLFDPVKKTWSKEACQSLGIPIEKLPETYSCTEVVGYVMEEPARAMGLNPGIPVVICAGDVGVAQVGAGTSSDGSANLYIGTGGWVGVANSKLVNNPGLPLWALNHIDPNRWIIAADLDTAGGSLMWMRDNLCELEIERALYANRNGYQLLSDMAASVGPGADNLLFFPWLSGERGHLGVGHTARGGFVGLLFGHGKAHMARAIMEGVAYHYRWMVESIEQAGVEIKVIKTVGGGCTSPTWLQIMSDVIGRELVVVNSPQEAGSVGTALIVATGLGFYQDLDSLDDLIPTSHLVFPKNDQHRKRYQALYEEFLAVGEQLLPHFYRLSKI